MGDLRELQNRLLQKEKEIYSIQKIGQALSNTLHLDQLLTLIMKEITHLMNADRSTLYLLDHRKKEIWSKIALKAEIKEIRQKIGVGISGYVAGTGEIINIPDAYQDKRFDPTTDKKTGYHTRSILCIPVWEPGTAEKSRKIMGVIQVLNKQEGPFTTEDEGILQAVASEVAIAISNARLYEQLEKKYNEIDLLYGLEQKLSGVYQLSELFQSILAATIRHLKCDETGLVFPEKGRLQYLRVNKKGRPLLKSLSAPGVSTFVEITARKDKNEILRTINQNLNSTFDYFKNIPLESVQGSFKSVIFLLNNKTQSFDFAEMDKSQVINIIAQKIIRAADLYDLRERLFHQERLSAVGQMMSTIVHDLRSPVNSIDGFLELLLEDDTTSDEKEEYAQIMKMELQSITQMTSEILDFAKGKTSILPRKVGVGDIIKRFQPQAEQLFRNSGTKLHIDHSSVKLLYADIDKLIRVFYNIAKNAKEALHNKGDFYFKVSDKDGEVIFELIDNGPGIPDEIKGRLFESFVTSGKESGTGLGLAIVKKIIDEHHGRIEIKSSNTTGTTFSVTLPEYKPE
ncbi:MAG: GAF domain-containing sensor histidine kinase [bacterium]|nr:MAG: GAF domain-containing sensor histidine kinase [bacterium]